MTVEGFFVKSILKRLLSDLAVTEYVVLVGNQLFKSEWTAVVQLVGTDGKLGSNTHLASIGKAARSILINSSAVDLLHKLNGSIAVFR